MDSLIKDNYDIGTFEEFQASLFPEGKYTLQRILCRL